MDTAQVVHCSDRQRDCQRGRQDTIKSQARTGDSDDGGYQMSANDSPGLGNQMIGTVYSNAGESAQGGKDSRHGYVHQASGISLSKPAMLQARCRYDRPRGRPGFVYQGHAGQHHGYIIITLVDYDA